jgi:hypothetical protein
LRLRGGLSHEGNTTQHLVEHGSSGWWVLDQRYGHGDEAPAACDDFRSHEAGNRQEAQTDLAALIAEEQVVTGFLIMISA